MEGSISTTYGPVIYRRVSGSYFTFTLEITAKLPARTYSRTTRSYTSLPDQEVKVVRGVKLDGENVWKSHRDYAETQHILSTGEVIPVRLHKDKYLPPGILPDAVKALTDGVDAAWFNYTKQRPDIARELWRERVLEAIKDREDEKDTYKHLIERTDAKIQMAKDVLASDNLYRDWMNIHRRVLCNAFVSVMAENHIAYDHLP